MNMSSGPWSATRANGWLLSVVGLTLLSGCGQQVVGGAAGDTSDVDAGMPDTGDTVSFARDIQPILTEFCATCHVQGGAADLAGIDLRLVQGQAYAMLRNGESQQQSEFPLVTPGDPDASWLMMKLTLNPPPVGLRMPRFAPPLSDADLNLIRRWIEQGAPNN